MRHPRSTATLLLVASFASAPLVAAGRDGVSLSVIVDGCEAPEYEHAGRFGAATSPCASRTRRPNGWRSLSRSTDAT
jgi:hypothetical protein